MLHQKPVNMACSTKHMLQAFDDKQWENINDMLNALHGITILHAAIKNGAPLNIIKRLATPNNINKYDDEGYAALHVALANQQWRLVAPLKELGADIDSVYIFSILDVALKYKAPSFIIKQLVPSQDCNLHMNLQIALHYKAPLDIIKLLLTSRNVNVQDNLGRYTPLHIVVDQERLDLVPVLLELGADVEATDCRRNTPLHTALKSGAPDDVITQLLSPNNVDWKNGGIGTPLTCALYYECMLSNISFKRLITQKNINLKDNQGTTPLIVAVRQAKWEQVAILLDHGADINLADNDGYTALHEAIRSMPVPLYPSMDMFARLISPRNINAETWCGQTPLRLAVLYYHQWELIHALLQHGANPYLSDILGEPPKPGSLQSLSVTAVRSYMQEKSDAAFNGLGLLPSVLLPELKMEPQAEEILRKFRRVE